MSKASDVAYGRQGGRIVPAEKRKATVDAHPPVPTDPAELRRHLERDHGFPPAVFDRHDPDVWPVWHAGEHSTRHPGHREPFHAGHLRHTHREAK